MKVTEKREILIDAFTKLSIPSSKKALFHPIVLTSSSGALTSSQLDVTKVTERHFSWIPFKLEAEEGERLVLDPQMLLSALDRMNDDLVLVTFEEGKISLTTSKKSVVFRADVMIGDTATDRVLKNHVVKLETDAGEVRDAVTGVGKAEYPKITLHVTPGIAEIIVGSLESSASETKTRIPAAMTWLKSSEDVRVSVSQLFPMILGCVEGKVDLLLAEKYPIAVVSVKDKVSVRYHIAPIVEG